MLCASLRPEYSHATQVMSALGETGSSTGWIMNLFGFVPTGLLIVGLSVSLRELVPPSLLTRIGSMLLSGFGGGIVAAGIFSCDQGCSGIGESLESFLHIVASVVAFGCGVAACGVWGIAFRGVPIWRGLYSFSVLSACISGVLLIEFNSAASANLFPGFWQRMFIGSLFMWCAVVGWFAFRNSAPGETDVVG
jgi:hypothetical membrane protein